MRATTGLAAPPLLLLLLLNRPTKLNEINGLRSIGALLSARAQYIQQIIAGYVNAAHQIFRSRARAK